MKVVPSPIGPLGTAWAISPDGSLVAASGPDLAGGYSADGSIPIHLISTIPGGETQTIVGPALSACALLFDSDGKRLLSPIQGETFVRFWDVGAKQEVGRYGPLEGKISRAAFSSDQRWVITGDTSGTINVWSTESRKTVKTFRFNFMSRQVRNKGAGTPWATFGNLLACPEDRRIVIWNLETGKYHGEVNDLGRPLGGLAFLSDGLRLASISEDKMTLWSVDTGWEILSLPINSVEYDSFHLLTQGLAALEKQWKATNK
jgi:WD40 repeat protein